MYRYRVLRIVRIYVKLSAREPNKRVSLGFGIEQSPCRNLGVVVRFLVKESSKQLFE